MKLGENEYKEFQEFKRLKKQKDKNIWVNLLIEFFVFGLVVLYWLYDFLHSK